MKVNLAAFSETPIYSALIAERGDIPARVRDEADRMHRLQEEVFSGSSISGRLHDAGPQGSLFGAAPVPPRASPSPPAG